MKTTLDLALARWEAASSTNRSRWGTQAPILLQPFLAGWAMRDMGAELPSRESVGKFWSSFKAGWDECDGRLQILAREEVHPFDPRPAENPSWPPTCRTCGLVEAQDCHAPPRRR